MNHIIHMHFQYMLMYKGMNLLQEDSANNFRKCILCFLNCKCLNIINFLIIRFLLKYYLVAEKEESPANANELAKQMLTHISTVTPVVNVIQ